MTAAPFTAVASSASPTSPRPIKTGDYADGHAHGRRSQVQYLFRVGYSDAAGWHWSDINSTYTTTATCTWTPTVAEAYTLVVWARLTGQTVNYDQYQAITYQITAS